MKRGGYLGIDLDIEKGQAVGLIERMDLQEHNLKLFTRIIYPNKGVLK